MAIKATIINGKGDKSSAKINKDGAVLFTEQPYPDFAQQKTEPFRQYFTDDGTDTGSNDLTVDGSVSNQDFYIESNSDSDRYIQELSLIMGYSTTGKPYLFADGSALTNGIRIFYTSQRGEIDIDSEVKNNQEFFRLGNDWMIPANWEVRHVGSNNDYGYFVNIDFRKFSSHYGIKLDKGTKQRIIVRIRDDLTSLTTLNIQAYGFNRFE